MNQSNGGFFVMHFMNRTSRSSVVVVLCSFVVLFTTASDSGQDKLIDVEGYKIQYKESGAGLPAVVFLNGGTAKMEYWDIVVKEISKISKVIMYERAGHDKSEMGREPRHGKNVVEELKVMLEKLNIPEPYILVAHSAGCMYARIFASQYPKAVAGLMLLDPGDKDFLDAFGKKNLQAEDQIRWETFWEKTWARLAKRPDGFGKEVQMKDTTISQMLDSKLPAHLIFYVLSGLDEDREDYYLTNFGDSAIKDFRDCLLEYHKSLVNGFHKGKQITVADAQHVIHMDNPNVVISWIEEMINLVKAKKDTSR